MSRTPIASLKFPKKCIYLHLESELCTSLRNCSGNYGPWSVYALLEHKAHLGWRLWSFEDTLEGSEWGSEWARPGMVNQVQRLNFHLSFPFLMTRVWCTRPPTAGTVGVLFIDNHRPLYRIHSESRSVQLWTSIALLLLSHCFLIWDYVVFYSYFESVVVRSLEKCPRGNSNCLRLFIIYFIGECVKRDECIFEKFLIAT